MASFLAIPAASAPDSHNAVSAETQRSQATLALSSLPSLALSWAGLSSLSSLSCCSSQAVLTALETRNVILPAAWARHAGAAPGTSHTLALPLPSCAITFPPCSWSQSPSPILSPDPKLLALSPMCLPTAFSLPGKSSTMFSIAREPFENFPG